MDAGIIVALLSLTAIGMTVVCLYICLCMHPYEHRQKGVNRTPRENHETNASAPEEASQFPSNIGQEFNHLFTNNNQNIHLVNYNTTNLATIFGQRCSTNTEDLNQSHIGWSPRIDYSFHQPSTSYDDGSSSDSYIRPPRVETPPPSYSEATRGYTTFQHNNVEAPSGSVDDSIYRDPRGGDRTSSDEERIRGVCTGECQCGGADHIQLTF